jgi:hypothetical protein
MSSKETVTLTKSHHVNQRLNIMKTLALKIIKLNTKNHLILRFKSTKTKKSIILLHISTLSSGKSMTWLTPNRHNLPNNWIPSKSKPLLSHLLSSKKVLNQLPWRLKTPKPLFKPKPLKNKKPNLFNHHQIGKNSCKTPKRLTTQLIKPKTTVKSIPKNHQLQTNPQSSSLWTASSLNATNLMNWQESPLSPKTAKHFTILTSNLRLKWQTSSLKSLASLTPTSSKLPNGQHKSPKSKKYSWVKLSLAIL